MIVTQEELTARAAEKTPSSVHVSVDNFLATPKYDEIVGLLSGQTTTNSAGAASQTEVATTVTSDLDLNYIDEVVFAHGKAEGSATMGQVTLEGIFKNKNIGIPVSKAANEKLGSFNAKNILVVTTIANQSEAQTYAPDAQFLVVESLVTTAEYDKVVARMHK